MNESAPVLEADPESRPSSRREAFSWFPNHDWPLAAMCDHLDRVVTQNRKPRSRWSRGAGLHGRRL